MAQQWAIFKVGTADLVPGQSDAWAYVLKGRASADEAPSEFEQLAMQRSCSLVLEVSAGCHSRLHSATWPLQGCMVAVQPESYGAEQDNAASSNGSHVWKFVCPAWLLCRDEAFCVSRTTPAQHMHRSACIMQCCTSGQLCACLAACPSWLLHSIRHIPVPAQQVMPSSALAGD